MPIDTSFGISVVRRGDRQAVNPGNPVELIQVAVERAVIRHLRSGSAGGGRHLVIGEVGIEQPGAIRLPGQIAVFILDLFAFSGPGI